MKSEPRAKLWIVIVFLAGLFLVSSSFAGCIALLTATEAPSSSGNVALIKIHGPIVSGEQSGFFAEDVAASDTIIDLLETAEDDPSIKAIMIEINSPGGSAVASDEIGTAMKALKKPTVSYIREVGASGGYWIASSTDYIFANRMSITGSIGVIGSYLEFSGLLRDWNITYEQLISGEHKDMGIPFKPLTKEERAILQGELDRIHIFFIEEVARNRNLTKEQVKELATGRIYLGIEAEELGLIDALGGRKDAEEYLRQQLNETITVAELEPPISFLDFLSSVAEQYSFNMGYGLGESLKTTEQNQLSIRT